MTIEPNKPNSGRIYDYMLGGNHNFEIDRKMAHQLQQIMPSMRNGMRINRWFMHEAVERLSQQDYDGYLDLATGLPTQGYIHELVPHAKVIYNDIDPITVAYAREILGDNPQVRYLQGNLADIDSILAEAELFLPNRRIGISLIGVAYFVSDQVIQNVLDTLYNWCDSGSQVAISWATGDLNNPRTQTMAAIYKQMGSEPYLRSMEQIAQLVDGWHVLEPGIKPLTEWLDVETWHIEGSNDEQIASLAGCIIHKP